MRIGIGYDSHRFAEGRKLLLGGIEIPYEKGLMGHSDADVLCHSITDALIGAAGLGSIGDFFPDSDPKWKDANSLHMLKSIVELIKSRGFKISWIDTVLITEKPKLSKYIDRMKINISTIGISSSSINIKAKTNEGMGFIGKGKGMTAITTCLLIFKDG